MKNSLFTKVLAWLLCALMVIGYLPNVAFADDTWEGETDVVDPSEPTPGESAENPIDFDFIVNEMTGAKVYTTDVQSDVTYYRTYTMGQYQALVYGDGNFSVVIGEQVYNAVDGTADLGVMGFNPYVPFEFAIDGTSEYQIVLAPYVPEGGWDNPATAQLGDNVATIEAGTEGYFWNYTADRAGALLVTVSGTNGWTYAINNLTVGTYGDSHCHDDSPVVASDFVTVAEGDVVQIIVNTYDPANMWAAPAGEVTVNLAYMTFSGSLSYTTHSCNFVGAVKINHFFKVDGFENLSHEYIMKNGGLLIFEEPVTEDNAVFGATDRYTEGLLYDSLYSEYYGETDGIPAAEYYITLYLRSFLRLPDGSYVYGSIQQYSVQKYCENQIKKTNVNEKQKNLCIATLHFGAAAQLRFGKGTDTLANANIKDTYPLPEYNSEWIGAKNEDYVCNLPLGNDVTRTACQVNVVGAVQIKYCLQTTVTNIEKIELMYWHKTTGELTEDNATFVEMVDWDPEYEEYFAYTEGIPAAEYGYTIYMVGKVTDTDGNAHYSQMYTYSVDTYANNQYNKTNVNEKQKNLVHAMAYFGEMARIRFGK